MTKLYYNINYPIQVGLGTKSPHKKSQRVFSNGCKFIFDMDGLWLLTRTRGTETVSGNSTDHRIETALN